VRSKFILAVPAVALSLLALGACGSSDPEASPATSSTAASTTSAGTTPAGTTPAGTTPTAETGTEAPATPADYSPIPKSPASTTAGRDGLDFGILTKVTTSNGIVTLHVDRTTFYLGKEAEALNKNDNIDDWAVKDTDGEGKELTFTLDPKASLQAEADLQDNRENTNKRVDLTRKQFLHNIDAVTVHYKKNGFDGPGTVYVWLRHTGGADGPVTALADQFVP
jgi:hypothetical protein